MTGGAERPEAVGAVGPAASGLVESETRDTQSLVQDRRLLRVYKSVSCAAELAQQLASVDGRRPRCAMVTLTYRPDVLWRPQDVKTYLKHVRQWLARRGAKARYVWVAELQRNGRVHYHVLFWLPRGITMPKADKQGWWPHGMTRSEWARKPVGYIVKYTSKGRRSDGLWFPRGCRLSGFGGLDLASRLKRSWWVLPRYQRERCAPEEAVRRAPGGGWVSKLTGEWWPSYWPSWAELNQGKYPCFA